VRKLPPSNISFPYEGTRTYLIRTPITAYLLGHFDKGKLEVHGKSKRTLQISHRSSSGAVKMAAKGVQMTKSDALMCLIGDEDTVTGFLLAGIGEVNKKNGSNYLVVTQSE